MKMNLTINGEARVLPSAETLAALVEQLGMKSDRVAIELNREIVPRDQWERTPLQDGDRLEIVHFVGGGTGPAVGESLNESQAAAPPQAIGKASRVTFRREFLRSRHLAALPPM